MVKFAKTENRNTNTNIYVYSSKNIDEAELIGVMKNNTMTSAPTDKEVGVVAKSIGGKNFHFKSESSLSNVKLEGKKTENGFYFQYKKV